MHKSSKKLTISTGFTILRIMLIPSIIGTMIHHQWGFACILFSIASLTDLLDGAFARLLDEHTLLGAYLDPIADKLLLLSCYSALAFVNSSLFTIPVWFVYVILIKELFLVFGTAYVCLVQRCITVKPTLLGKLTAVVQMCFIMSIIFCSWLYWLPNLLLHTFLWLVLALSLASCIQYSIIGFRGLRLCFSK